MRPDDGDPAWRAEKQRRRIALMNAMGDIRRLERRRNIALVIGGVLIVLCLIVAFVS